MAMEKLPLELSSGQGGSSTKWPWSFFGSMNANVRPFLDENIKIVVEKKGPNIFDKGTPFCRVEFVPYHFVGWRKPFCSRVYGHTIL